ncbi:centromere-associated protein E-like [Patiria miniata]|uniref:Kinesin motor domain-containing protein n=1 Tax=Patiria miniata TaxID=46514 RepID=A0A914BU63_PATMI|nr:centromere-associated protein E-like [Patiria miniata]
MDNVHVAIRVRPLIQREKQVEAATHWKADTHTVVQLDQRGKACRKEYVFDRVFDSSETTNDVYEEIAQPIVVEAMDGINGTIFAYGQTSSGKTHTMMGDSRAPGIIPCAIQDIFDSIENTQNREFLLRVSYMELYNEGLCDLLSSEKKPLQIREVDKRVFVHDLTEQVVTQPEDVLQLLKKGEAQRHYGQTDMNERSSRSHTIFCMIIESRERADRKRSMELAVKVSHLNLVDLAGSERANETKAEGARLKEACRINQSLHQLAMVINKLSQGAEFIPFRDSKLTRILQMSLGGNAKTAIICTITPASIEQTHSTLQFASRAKTIKNKPQINEVVSDEAMMQRQKKEIQELKRKVLELEQQGELLEEKASLHEQQEQKIKLLEKMILVSGGAGIPSVMPGSETKKAKYKRRQTWCPGMNRLPLLPLSKPAGPAAVEEVSFISLPPSSALKRTHDSSDGGDLSSSPPVSPVASICSDDFSQTKQLEFLEDIEQNQNTEEDSFLAPLPLSPQRIKKKRRRAHVHFSMPLDSDTVDAECQTEPSEAQTDSEGTVSGIIREEQTVISELKDKVCALESTIVTLEDEKRSTLQLQQEIDQSKKYAEDLQNRIVELESTATAREETAEATANLSEALQASNDQCSELKQQVACLEGKLASFEEEKATVFHLLKNQEALEQECKELREKGEEMENEIKSLEEENLMVNQLSDALCLSEEKVAELEGQVKDADCRVAALTKDISELKAQLEEQQGSSVSAAHESELEILALKSQLQEHGDALSASSQQSEAEVAGLRETIGELEAAISSLRTEREELSALPQSLKAKEMQLEELCQMYQQAEETIASLKQEKAAMRQEFDQQNDTIDQSTKDTSENIAKVKELEETIQLRDEEQEVVNQLLEEQRQELETINQNLERQREEAEKQEQEAAQRIAELGKLLEEQRQEVETLKHGLQDQGSEASSRMQDSAATIAALTRQLQALERKQGALADDGQAASAEERTREFAVPSENDLEQADEKVKELTMLLQVRQEEIDTLNTFLHEQAKDAEEMRSHHVARIAELTALLEEQQGQLAMSEAASQGCLDSGVGSSLADELGTQEWKAKARRTESDLLGSVQLCEDIMEEKSKIALQMNELQEECSSLKESLRVKVADLQSLQELHEFIKMEATVTKEQEMEYQNNIEELKKELADQGKTLAAQFRQEIQDLQKKLSTKDKVLEAQYQQDIDELLHKLREKNQKVDSLQEQNAGLAQAIGQKEQLAESLRRRLSDLIRPLDAVDESAVMQKLAEEVPAAGVDIDEGTQTELGERVCTVQKIVGSSEEATQVTLEDFGFHAIETSSQTEAVQEKMTESAEAAVQPEVLQLKLVELEAREAALRRECDSLTMTISSRDQEIEVLNEILQDYGQEKDGETDDTAKIAAFVQRIEELEEKLKGSTSNPQIVPLTDTIEQPVIDQASTDENKSLADALSRSETLREELHIKVQSLEETLEEKEVGASTELSHLQKELEVLTENNLSQSEKITAVQAYCSELEAKILVVNGSEQKDYNQEIHLATEALEQQLQEQLVSQKAEWVQIEDELKDRIKHLEERAEKLSQENQDLLELKSGESKQVNSEVASEKEALLEEQRVLRQFLKESSNKVRELEAAVALMGSQSRESAETIKNRDDEIEMLRQVLGEQEEQLEATRNDNKVSVSRIKDLECRIETMHQKISYRTVEKNEEDGEICRLRGILEDQEELLRTKDNQNVESLSRIEYLESALAAKSTKIQENSQVEAEQLDKIQRLQNCLDEQADQLRCKDEMCSKLGEKLRDLERVLAAKNSKGTEWEAIKLKQEEEIQVLEQELRSKDELCTELSAKLLDVERVVSAMHSESPEWEAVKLKQEEKIQMLELELRSKDEMCAELTAKLQDVERVVSAMHSESPDWEAVKLKQEEEIEMLQCELRSKQETCAELSAKVQDLERVVSAMHSESSQQEEEVQMFERELRSRNETCAELGAKLQDLERVMAAMDSKSAEWEAAKLKHGEEIQMLERELDDMGEEYSQHKNTYAALQRASRDQQARIKELEAVITKQNEEIKVFRALLDERNQKVLNHEDRYYEMFTQVQNLESAQSVKEQTILQLEDRVQRLNGELQQVYTALSDQEKELQAHCSELKEQLKTGRNSLSTKEQQMKQLQEMVNQRGQEISSLQRQLDEFCQQKNGFLTDVSKKEEEFRSMQRALQDYQSRDQSSAQEIKALEVQVHQLTEELETAKASTNEPEEVERLQKEKNEIQSQLDKISRKLQRKATDLTNLADTYDGLKLTCCELEDEFEEEKAQHEQTKVKMEEAQARLARLEELEKQSLSVEELVKSHRQEIATKNLRINELETDLLRGTDPLEDKIRSLRSEVQYQERKVQQYKKELEKLRSEQSQQAHETSNSASATVPERAPEATGGSGIIESCAIFAMKAENHKLTKSLEKAKRELEHKDMKYHDQVSKKTEAEQEARYWKDKARSMASHLKRAPPSHVTDSSVSSPLKELDANDPTSHQALPKRTRAGEPPRSKYVEKIPGLQRPAVATKASQQQQQQKQQQREDRNWLTKAVAERDASETGRGADDDPQQCATQ